MSALPDAATILRCFCAGDAALSHGELVRRTGLPKSTVSRLLAIMRAEELLNYDETSRAYRPGLLLFRLGQVYRAQHRLLPVLDCALEGLTGGVGHTAYVAVRDGAEQVVIRAVPGKNPLRVITAVGERSAIHATSNGRALLARLESAALRDLFPDGALPFVSPNTPRHLDDLMPRLAQIRNTGLSEARNETLAGVASLGIAILDPETQEGYGIAASFSSLATPPEEIRQIGRALLALGREVGASVGDEFWTRLPADREAV